VLSGDGKESGEAIEVAVARDMGRPARR
jgi:hypothetical protein